MSDEVILTSDKNESNTQETKSFLSKIKIMLKSDRFKKIITAFIIILNIAMIFSLVTLYNKMSRIQTSIEIHELIYHDKGSVDLSIGSFQQISEEFSAGKFNVIQHLDGIKISGIILNKNSIRYSDSDFQITVNGQTQEFQIKNIPAGYASEFNVYIPNVPVDKSRWGKISYIKGKINYNITFN